MAQDWTPIYLITLKKRKYHDAYAAPYSNFPKEGSNCCSKHNKMAHISAFNSAGRGSPRTYLTRNHCSIWLANRNDNSFYHQYMIREKTIQTTNRPQRTLDQKAMESSKPPVFDLSTG